MTDTSISLDPHPLDLTMTAPHDAKARREGEQVVSAGSAAFAAPAVVLALHGDMAAVEELWRSFEAVAQHTFFQTFAWLDAWVRTVGKRIATVPAIVTAHHPDGTLLFILPLAIQRRGGLRQLTFLGSDLCDYNAPLLHPKFGETIGEQRFTALWTEIIDLLREDPRFAFDVIDLAKMPETVGGQPNPLMAIRTEPNPSGAYLTALSGTWDEFYAVKRSSSTRKKERQQLRQLVSEFGEVRFVDELEGDERTRTLDLLFEQKARSFERMGVRNIFERPGYRELFTSFAMDPKTRHLVHLSRLEIGTTIAAVSVGFTAGSCYYLVISSYEGGAIARSGPGRVHLHELLRYALRNGFRCFDFTIGDELYKQDWSDARLTLYDHLSSATLRGGVAVALVNRFRATKRAIKQNPQLWRLFSRTRSLLGAMKSRKQNEPRQAA